MISLYDILEASNGQLFGEAGAQLFSGFCLDASQAKESELFVAIRGDYGDTHQDMEEAVRNGVTGILCTRPPEFDTEGLSIIVVRDTENALMSWAKYVLSRFPTNCIVVTGTSGRSTTISAIAKVLGVKYNVHANPDRFQRGRLNLPLMLANLEASHDFVVLDLVADQPGELSQMIQIANPHVSVVTRIGQAYLDSFRNVDEVAQEHEFAVKSLAPSDLAVLNYDDDNTRLLASKTRAHSMSFGIDSFGADLMAYNLVIGPTRTGFDLRFNNQRYVGKWAPLLGKHQLYSVLAALAVGVHFDVNMDKALRALTQIDALPGRMNTLIGVNGALVIDDTHDANPDSTLDALNWLAEVKDEQTRAIFVFGDMDHLGEATRLAHRAVGQRAAEVADVIITEGAQAAMAGRAAQDVASQHQRVYVNYSMQDTITSLTDLTALNENDIVLIKGDTTARMERAVEAILYDQGDRDKLPRQTDSSALSVEFARPLRPSWVEIDREALAQNVRILKDFVGSNVTLMATVKANAYGHGAVAISRVAIQNGAGYLAVASMSEALELRDAGIDAPILVLSYTPVYAIIEALRHNITVTVYDLALARAYNRIAKEMGGKLRIHVKLDSGMGRLGILPEEAVVLFRHLLTMQNLDIEGIYTHLSAADEDGAFSEEQLRSFKAVLVPLRAGGVKFKYTHVANSAGTVLGSDYHFNMVRIGIIMYGCSPSQIATPPKGLRPLMTWKTVIAQVKTLPPGHAVGYGNTYRTSDYEKVAVIPVGYADGLNRLLSNKGEVLVNGKRAPIRGRVSMEKTVISVQDVGSVSIGDEVVLLGEQNGARISAEEIAEWQDTISYEVLTSILPGVPRR